MVTVSQGPATASWVSWALTVAEVSAQMILVVTASHILGIPWVCSTEGASDSSVACGREQAGRAIPYQPLVFSYGQHRGQARTGSTEFLAKAQRMAVGSEELICSLEKPSALVRHL